MRQFSVANFLLLLKNVKQLVMKMLLLLFLIQLYERWKKASGCIQRSIKKPYRNLGLYLMELDSMSYSAQSVYYEKSFCQSGQSNPLFFLGMTSTMKAGNFTRLKEVFSDSWGFFFPNLFLTNRLKCNFSFHFNS